MAMSIGFFADAGTSGSFASRNIKALHQAYETTGRQPEEKQRASSGLLGAASEKVSFLSETRNVGKMTNAFVESMMNGSDLAISSPRGPGL